MDAGPRRDRAAVFEATGRLLRLRGHSPNRIDQRRVRETCTRGSTVGLPARNDWRGRRRRLYSGRSDDAIAKVRRRSGAPEGIYQESGLVMEDLRGASAIVTGAAQGLGYAIATAYIREGMRVAIMDVQ